MNEQLQQALATMIEKSIKAFEAGADFMAAEIPDAIHQLLLWHMVRSSAEAVFGIIIAVLLVIVDYRVFRTIWDKDHDWYEDFMLGYVLLGSIVRVPLWIIAMYFVNLTWLKIWIAPKIFLIEYAAKLVK